MAGSLALLNALPAHAQFEYGLEAGYGHSDNVFRSSDNEITSDILTAGLQLDWEEDRTRLDANVHADLDFNHYLDGDADDQVTGNANGQVAFAIVPERFAWLIQDTFGQAQEDPLAPATPESLESTNFVSTGPDFTMRMGDSNALRLSGRYSLTTYEVSPYDSTRVGGRVSFLRQLSDRSSWGLNASLDDVDFDDAGSIDFTSRNASFTYELEAARTDINTELGYTWIEHDVTGESEQDGPLVRIEVRRRVSTSSYLNLRAGTLLADASEAMRDNLDAVEQAGGEVISTASSSVYENNFAELGWQFDRPRTSIDVFVSYDNNVYDSQPELDRKRLMVSSALERHLSNRLLGRIRIAWDTEDVALDGSEADEFRVSLGASWRFGRDTGIELWGERIDRDSNTTSGGGESVENRIFLTLFYRPPAR
ncbi:MAG TPA: hypothetical protein VFS58_13555 [Steroidobacteraceae bacterium]|nr:hypothetical protein [Steroidobacteraceae bacterium]